MEHHDDEEEDEIEYEVCEKVSLNVSALSHREEPSPHSHLQ
jgi:hypothetical protein